MLNLSIVLYRSKNFQLFFLISWNGLNTRNFYEYHTKCCKIKVLKYLKRPLRTLKWIIPLRVRDAEVVGSNPVTSTTWQGRRNSWGIKGFGVFLCLNFLLFSKAIFYFNYLGIEIFIFCAKISLSGREDFPLPEFVETSSNTKAKYHKSTRRMNMKRKRKRNLYHLWFCFAMLLFLAVPFKVKAEQGQSYPPARPVPGILHSILLVRYIPASYLYQKAMSWKAK